MARSLIEVPENICCCW